MNKTQLTAALNNMLRDLYGETADVYAVDTDTTTFKAQFDGEETYWSYQTHSGILEDVTELSYEDYCDEMGYSPDYGD